MNMWSILGIQPTDDISIIKKAYAKKLKENHPEENAEGYQYLRKAYDDAVKYSKLSNKRKAQKAADLENEEILTEEIQNETPILLNNMDFEIEMLGPKEDEIPTPPHINLTGDNNNSINIEDLNDKFIKQIEELYNDIHSRIDINKWHKVLNCDLMWNIKNRDRLGNKMIMFLSEHHYLPQNIWKLLNSNFNWAEQQDALVTMFPQILVKYILKQINQKKSLGYSFLNKIENYIDIEKYLEYREKGFDAINENDWETAYSFINRAKEIFSDDTDLLWLEGEYYLQTRNNDMALKCFNHLLGIAPHNTEVLYNRAKIYYQKGLYSSSSEDCIQILQLSDEFPEVTQLIIDCSIKSKEWEKSKEYLIKALNKNPSDRKLKSLLLMVDVRIELKLRRTIRFGKAYIELIKQKQLVKSEIKELNKELNPDNILLNKIYIIMLTALVVICLILFFVQKFLVNNN